MLGKQYKKLSATGKTLIIHNISIKPLICCSESTETVFENNKTVRKSKWGRVIHCKTVLHWFHWGKKKEDAPNLKWARPHVSEATWQSQEEPELHVTTWLFLTASGFKRAAMTFCSRTHIHLFAIISRTRPRVFKVVATVGCQAADSEKSRTDAARR